jgi:predicted MPP superfamily phosphohydrolase
MNYFRKYPSRTLFALGLVPGIPLVMAVWAFFIEPDRLIVVEERLELSGWPQSHGKLRIALFSDLHAGAPFMGREKIESLVATVNETKPDLVIMAGDFVIDGVLGGNHMTAKEFVPILARLQASLGLFAVLGNHDHWNGARSIASALEAVGIKVLENEAVKIPRADGDFWLVGLADFMAGRPDAGQAFEGTDGAPAISVTHNPDIYASDRLPVALALAGHTHGGQVTLPLIGPPVVPSIYGDRYARGLVVERGMPIFVTSGLGTSILPLRLGVPPEVVLLTVTAK